MALNDLPIDLPDLGPGDELIKETVAHTETSNERSLARRMALQALYEIDSTGHDPGTVLTARMLTMEQPASQQIAGYMQRLVTDVTENRLLLDDILRRYALEFPLAQIAIIDRNILRIATLEFALLATTPVGVAIDEAVELAKLFGAEGSSRFVNGVLGALADDQAMLTQLAADFAAHTADRDGDPDGDRDANRTHTPDRRD